MSLGTWKIIYSCCFTLSLCVITAIHMNVGPAGETTVEWWRRKCKWIIIATVSPEIMLYTAGKQWFSASRLCKKLNGLTVEEQTEMPSSPIRPFWGGSKTPARAVSDSKRVYSSVLKVLRGLSRYQCNNLERLATVSDMDFL